MDDNAIDIQVKGHRLAMLLHQGLKQSDDAFMMTAFGEHLHTVLNASLRRNVDNPIPYREALRVLTAIRDRLSINTMWTPLANASHVLLHLLMMDHVARRQVGHLVGASLEWIIEDERGG